MSINSRLLYRLCLKQLRKIKEKDPEVSAAALQGLRTRKNSKQWPQILMSMNKMLGKSNQSDEKAIIKLVRVFTGNSQFVTADLQFRPGYISRPLNSLKQDLEFKQLGSRDQQFVISVIQRICDKKPDLKYKTVAKYLESPTTENAEMEIFNSNLQLKVDERQLNNLSRQSEWKWAYSRLQVNREDKINQIIQEMVDRKIVLL